MVVTRGGLPCALSVVAVLILATPLPAERLIVHSYSVTDGLASNRVSCIATDGDGFLWVCTNGGLSRFDGARFVTYEVQHGLPDPAVNHFLQTRTGSRWVATNGGGVARLEPAAPDTDGRVFRAFQVGSTPRSMRVNILFENPDGDLLAGTDGGLFRARYPDSAPRFELVPLSLPGYPDGGLQIWGMVRDGAGRTWVGTSGGLVVLRGVERVGHIPIAPAQGADHVYDIVSDAGGRLWLGHDGGLLVWTPPAGDIELAGDGAPLWNRAPPCIGSESEDALTAVQLPVGVGSACHWVPGGERPGASRIRSLHQADDGWIWMASHAGLAAFDGARLRLFDTSHGFPARGVSRVSVDQGGDVWAGSTGGVNRILRRGFTLFTAEDGLAGQLMTIQRGSDGRLYVISSTSTIHRFDGDRWTGVRPNLPAFVGRVGRSIYGAALLDREGTWWIGTGAGLFRFPAVARLEELAEARPLAHYTVDDGLAGNDIWNLFEDASGDIWIGTRIPGREALTRWERSTGRLHRYGPTEGVPAERAIYSFVEDASGNLWASIWDGGLLRFDGHRFEFFPPGEDVPPGHLNQLLVDRRGWLWVAGRQTFFSRDPSAPEPRFEAFGAAGGRPFPSFGLSEDSNGWVYAGTFTGLVRFRGDNGHIHQVGFGQPFSEARAAFHRDVDGTLWFPTSSGVLRYTPGPVRDSRPPPVRIGAIRVGGAPVPVPPLGATTQPPLRLAAGQRQVQVDYFGLGFGSQGPVRFQVRLDGLDEQWGDPTPQASVLYAGLGPGRYRFQVRAVNGAGQVSAEPATATFVIPPPFWRRGWFLAAFGAFVVISLGIAHRLRVRRLLELERIRTRIAADLHDDLGASLARVSLLSEATRRSLRDTPDRADRMLEEIGATSRDLVAAAGDIAFSIDPGRGRLDGLVARVRRFAEDALAGTGIDWRFTVNGQTEGVVLSSEQRRHLLAIVKESLHNAVRHGRPRHLSLSLVVRDDVLEVEIRDDGCGFPVDSPADRLGSKVGQGMRNIRRRARELGAELDVLSRPGAGTTVFLRCPLRATHRTVMR